MFYEPAGLCLWQSWKDHPTEENQNNLVMYCSPLIKAIIYSNPHLQLEKSITRENFGVSFNELVIELIIRLPGFDPLKGTLHGYLSFKLFKALWNVCNTNKKGGMRGIPKVTEKVGTKKKVKYSFPVFGEMDEIKSGDVIDLEIFLEHLLKNADLTFYEIHTFNNLLGLIRTNPAKLSANPVSVLHEQTGLSVAMTKAALANLQIYYYYSERVKC